MTSHRNQKAAVRAFAEAHACSYTEARRLMGLTTTRWAATDAETGVHLEAELRGNEVNLIWAQADDVESCWRMVRTHVLLGADVWPKSDSLLTEAGELKPAWDDDHVLPLALVQQLRAWVRTQVQRPELLSQDEENFVFQSRQPVDRVISVVDKHQRTAVVHVYRGPLTELPDGPAPAVIATNTARIQAFASAASAQLWASYEPQDLEDHERFYVLDGFPAAGVELDQVLELRRFVVDKELLRERVNPIDPSGLTWTIVEHVDF